MDKEDMRRYDLVVRPSAPGHFVSLKDRHETPGKTLTLFMLEQRRQLGERVHIIKPITMGEVYNFIDAKVSRYEDLIQEGTGKLRDSMRIDIDSKAVGNSLEFLSDTLEGLVLLRKLRYRLLNSDDHATVAEYVRYLEDLRDTLYDKDTGQWEVLDGILNHITRAI